MTAAAVLPPPTTGPTGGHRARAAVWRGSDTGLVTEDVVVPDPGPGEVLLRVRACGACHSDLHKMHGPDQRVPTVLGHEVSGVVEAVGPPAPGQRPAPVPGRRVLCSFVASCGTCRACERGREELCLTFREQMHGRGLSLAGQPRYWFPDGGVLLGTGMAALSELVVVPANAVFALPDEVPLAEAAVLGCAGLTAYGSVHRTGRVQRGEVVVVLATGGVGLCAAAIARHAGAAQVIAVDVRPEAAEAALAHGATAAVSGDPDRVRARVAELTDGCGADVVLDTISTAATTALGLDLLDTGGRLVCSGLAGTAPAQLSLVPLVRRKLQVLGNYAARTAEDLPALLEVVRDGGLDPVRLVAERHPLGRAQAAYDALEAGVAGRVLIDVSPRLGDGDRQDGRTGGRGAPAAGQDDAGGSR